MILELQHHIEIDAVYSPGGQEDHLYVTIECRWCPWIVEVEAPIILADLVERAGRHFDDSGRCIPDESPRTTETQPS